MGFVDAVKSAFSNYANFNGRASRSEFWWFYLFFVILYFLFGFVVMAMPKLGFLGLGFLALIVPFISLAARRMHDTDHSGWFQLIPIYSLYLAIIKGTDGPNRFGDDPVG